MKHDTNKAANRRFALYAGLALLALPALAPAADRSGKQVVEAVCIECHGPGKDGAPRIGNAYEWASHAKIGLEKLTENAIGGVRKMPAHGGQPNLTDLEISRAVAYMVSNGNAKDPDRAYATLKRWEGEQIVGEVCANCHVAGQDGAPKLGEAGAWLPRLKDGMDRVVNSAIKGHNNMPARGGMTNLSDAEIKAAVSYMISRIAIPRQP